MLGTTTRRLIATVPALALVIAAVWVGTASSQAGATTVPRKRVQANNFYFCAIVKTTCSSTDSGHVTTIKKGTRVVWVYKDTRCDAIALCPGHNVKVRTWTASPTVKSDGAVIYQHIFRHTGLYHYVCTHHKNTGMTGYIKVISP
jgi:plastocyanin